jgi:telomere length regulation protein
MAGGTEKSKSGSTPTSSDEALEVLRHEPDHDSLVAVLRFLSQGQSLQRPSPQSAQIVQVLVSDIVANYWALLKEDRDRRKGVLSGFDLLLLCLRNLSGINAILLRLRALTQEFKSDGDAANRPDLSLNLGILLELLTAVLDGDGRVRQLWTATVSIVDDQTKRRILSQELLVLLGGGRAISLSAEAEDIAKTRKVGGKFDGTWLSDGSRYATWLGQNIAVWASSASASELSADEGKFCSALFMKALQLRSPGRLRTITLPFSRY